MIGVKLSSEPTASWFCVLESARPLGVRAVVAHRRDARAPARGAVALQRLCASSRACRAALCSRVRYSLQSHICALNTVLSRMHIA